MGEACKVPVFRYALERWESDAYRAVILYRGADLKSSVEVLAAPLVNAPANLEVELINVADLTEEQKWQIGRCRCRGQDTAATASLSARF